MGKRGPKPGTPATGRQRETLIKPGEVRNPSGTSGAIQKARMKLEESSLKFLMGKVEATDPVTGKKVKMTRHELQLQVLFNESIKKGGDKNLASIMGMWEWTKTKPTTKVEITGGGGGAITTLTGELTAEQAAIEYRKLLKGE